MPDESQGFGSETGSTPEGVTLFRKKPIALEARQVCSPLGRETAAWCGGRYDDVLHHIIVHTLEGPLVAHSGDWIIKGTRGEFWPVRGDIFAETYEPASSPDPAPLSGAAIAHVRQVDAHLDANTAAPYRDQPLAGDWARVTKVCEEAGEVWRALSKLTGENPRKGVCGTEGDLLDELGDTAMAAMCAIQHLTKDTDRTQAVLATAISKAAERVARHNAVATAGAQ